MNAEFLLYVIGQEDADMLGVPINSTCGIVSSVHSEEDGIIIRNTIEKEHTEIQHHPTRRENTNGFEP